MKKLRLVYLVVLLAICTISSAFAQEAPKTDRNFDLQTFRSAPGRGNFFTVEGARVDEHLGWTVGAVFGYSYRPLGIGTPNASYALVKHHGTVEVLGSLSIYEVLEFGMVLPVVFYQNGEDVILNGQIIEKPSDNKAGMGDPRLHIKLDLLNGAIKADSDTFGLALILVTSFPVGNAISGGSFFGDSNVTVAPKLAFEIDIWKLRFGFNLGYIWREHKEFYEGEIGQRITFGFATEYKPIDDLKLMLELFGENGFTTGATSTPLEMYGGIGYQVYDGLWLTAGAGSGLSIGDDEITRGLGAPTFRGLLSLKYEPDIDHDPDKDGIMDDVDKCPDSAEDVDGYRDNDGCPELDNDKDGIQDTKDECPNKAEDKDGFEDDDGCPEYDNDLDGLEDKEDKCPNEAEDMDRFEDSDGCPDLDNDKDGILDNVDKCPIEPETVNEYMDEDGCPDTKPKLIEVTDTKIELKQKVFFKTGRAKILNKSFEMLNEIATVLKENKKFKVRIEGHTDSRGSLKVNRRLSLKRAEAVKKYLASKGVEENRLSVKGYGPDKPIAPNSTRAGRAANRRVEFLIEN